MAENSVPQLQNHVLPAVPVPLDDRWVPAALLKACQHSSARTPCHSKSTSERKMLKMVVIMNYDFEYMCQGMLEFIRPTLTVRLEVCEGGRVS